MTQQRTVHHRSVQTRLGPVPVRIVGEGAPVLAVHGFLLDGRLWDPVAEALDGRVQLVLPDLPLGAHCVSVPDRSRLSPPEVAAALPEILDGLGLDEALLVGNDTGGAICQLAAAASPGRWSGLVLAGVDAFEHFPPPLLWPLVRFAAVPGVMRLSLRAFDSPRLLGAPSRLNLLSHRGLGVEYVHELLRPARSDARVRGDVVAFASRIRNEPLLAAAATLPAFAGRAAVLWSRNDRFFPPRDAERLAELLGTQVVWLDACRTMVPVDRPDAVADAILSVLAQGARPRRDGQAPADSSSWSRT